MLYDAQAVGLVLKRRDVIEKMIDAIDTELEHAKEANTAKNTQGTPLTSFYDATQDTVPIHSTFSRMADHMTASCSPNHLSWAWKNGIIIDSSLQVCSQDPFLIL